MQLEEGFVLPQRFYLAKDVVLLAKNLLGKVLVTKFNGEITAGLITETEAYNGIIDKASHAYGNRRTARTATMYLEGGIAYVYLCYGIHHLFNVVTNEAENPHAILIRGIQPCLGIDIIKERLGKTTLKKGMIAGPGLVSKALGLTTKNNGTSLNNKEINIYDLGIVLSEDDLQTTPRIGVDYAEEDALLPYRFLVKNPINT